MEYKYVKGVNETPDGQTMSIDFSPFKTCSFNCVYCGLGPTTTMTTERSEFYPADDVFTEIRNYMEENGEPDNIMLTGSGEPALYSGFGDLARKVKENYPHIRLMVYTNGSLLDRKQVRDDFSLCDLVWINLNSIDENEFRRISRHHEDIRLEHVLAGIRHFREDYRKTLFVDVKFIKGLNDSERNVEGLRDFFEMLSPDKCFVYAKRFEGRLGIEPTTDEFKEIIKTKWKNLAFPVVFDF